ncbi:MAG: HAMP domain-containing protein [Candidatus Thiodiazotropha sp. (ex Lucinoma annulata)]|nr:HAMP domain-containing protein [Candidatus Thiodiazotropha sp. (ex Lucinoma borealis)]MCU7884026.1 HAMP domain-containing protein [Candidatus Thiodiazotropha sp. (ex Lucinoma annulata)]
MKRRHSLSGRLILLFLCASILIALTVRTGFYYGVQGEFRTFAAPHLLEYINHLRQQIGSPPDIQAAQTLASRLQLDIQINFAGEVWSSSGKDIDDATLAFHTHRLADGRLVEVSHDRHRYLLRLQEADTTLLLMTRDRIGNGPLPLIIGVTIVAILLLIALTYHLVRRLFQPIQTIRQSVARFGSGEFDQRITLQRRDELGELANSINTMADEIQAMLEAKRQLLLAISHELRSPLTRARLNAELLDESEPRARIIADIQLLEQQLAELLETEHLENRHAKLDLQSTVPKNLIESVIQQHFSTSRLSCHHEDDNQPIKLDAVRIRLLIRNLLDNALKHSPESTEPVMISSRIVDQTWAVTVQDHGHGIPAEHLPHLTEPFYRVDKSRQRETGGYGLGLYLCRVITEAHRGTLQIDSKMDKGTCVTFTVPL